MKGMTFGRVGGLIVLLLCGAIAAAPVRAKSSAASASSSSGKTSASMSSVTGPVKGAPTGKTFVIATKGKTVTVDASGAHIRENGQFVSMNTVKAGMMVTAGGTMNGTTLKAKEITLHPSGKKGSSGGGSTSTKKG